jgi:glycosyltransferase involved in cell wall biosynthesis
VNTADSTVGATTGVQTTARASVSIIVPAFNEGHGLRSSVLTAIEAVAAVDRLEAEIVIINDGSSDNTAAVADGLAQEFPIVRCIHFSVNRGFGAGFRAALESTNNEYITFIAGDNVVSKSMLREILKHIGQADLVCAFPVNVESRPRLRRLISSVFSFVYRQTFNLDLRAIHTTPAYPVRLLRNTHLRSQGYSLAAEVIVKTLRQGGTFLELPGYLNVLPDKSSALKMKTLVEVVTSFFLLIGEVYVFNRNKYSRRAVRVVPKELRD